MLRTYRSKQPRLGARVFIDRSAQVVGDVHLGDDVSVWMGAVLRGDVNSIHVGARSNVQDNAVIHVDFGEHKVEIGQDATIGHGVILHGCRIEDAVLIGMGATVLNGARVGAESIVAAGALVTEGMEIPPRSLVMGVPAAIKRTVSDEETARLRASAEHYVSFKNDYLREGASQ
ncbi:MAG: gamma carbonic anhydrase family protein [Vicinamibacteria bacterium]|nr:gamma carbonic anhydrase family protein [Vicinamibacteria bacterium]